MEQRPKTCGLRFIIDVTTPSTSVCNLSIFVDYDLTMQTHVSRTVSRCFAAQQHLQSVRHSVASDAFQWLIASTILTRLEYGNAMLSGNSAGLIICLQSVLDAAIRMIFRLHQPGHHHLHWLRTPEMIDFKLAATVCMKPHQVTCRVTINALPKSHLANACDRRHLWDSSSPDASC